ncbi:MAG: hypothetical protein ABSG76_18310 [Xanthobacteraceae bacterium]|jgi:hypothetical protein
MTAISFASRASEALERHHEMIAAQRAHEHTRNLLAMSGLVAGLILLLVLGWVSGVTSFIVWPTASGRPAVEFDEHSFYRTGTGRIVFVPFNGQRCLKAPFNNRTGRIGEGEHVSCDDVLPQRPPEAAEDVNLASRLSALRSGFNKQR